MTSFLILTDQSFSFIGKKGHFIGKVDPNTPASAAGLKVGDRIIEVNGHNVVNETHKQVRFIFWRLVFLIEFFIYHCMYK